jgi:drug/metabolite transporter (DMT)-like permease
MGLFFSTYIPPRAFIGSFSLGYVDWIFYAIAAMTFFGIANVTDKVLLTHRVKNPYLPVIVDMILGLIFASVIFLFYGITPLSGTSFALAIALGILNVAIYSVYFKSLQSEEVSRIVPLYLLSNFVIFFLSISFLGRVFSFWQVGGAALILGGAFLITQHDFRKIHLSNGVLFALAGTLMSSLFIVASDYLLQGVSVETFFVYTRTSSFVAGLVLIWIYRKDFSKMVLNPSKYGFGIIIRQPVRAAVLGLIPRPLGR